SIAKATKATSSCWADRATKRRARPRLPAPASAKTGSSMRSNGRWNSAARSANRANVSSTPIGGSARMGSRRRSMAEGTLRCRDDPVLDEPAVSLDAFIGQSNAVSVRIEAGDDVRQLEAVLDRLRLVEIDFPKFRDGRG